MTQETTRPDPLFPCPYDLPWFLGEERLGRKVRLGLAATVLAAACTPQVLHPSPSPHPTESHYPAATATLRPELPTVQASPILIEVFSATIEPTEDLSALPRWDERREKWSMDGIEGEYQGVNVTVNMGVDYSLYDRESFPIQGWEENHGTFEDIANAVAAGVSFMPQAGGDMRIVEPNMILYEDGTYEPIGMNQYNPRVIGQGINKEQRFDPSVPIRILWFDGGKNNIFPLQPYTNGISYGWGVDPETQGLVIFLGQPESSLRNAPDINKFAIDTMILEAMLMMTNSWFGEIQNQGQYDELTRQWVGDNPERLNTYALDGGTIKQIYGTSS